MFKNQKIRGCLVTVGIGCMFMGGTIVFNRDPGAENFLNTGFDLKNIALLFAVCGYLAVTVLVTRFRILSIIGIAAVGSGMFVGSFGGSSVGSWGWGVSLVTILVIAPLAAILCISAGAFSLVQIMNENRDARRPICITGTASIAFSVSLLFLIIIGPDLNPAVSLISSADKHERIAAARALAKIHDRRAINPMIELLSDPDGEIRASAAEILGSFILAGMNSDTRSIKPLIKAMQDKDARVRAAAALSLGRITEHLDSAAAQWPVEPLKTALHDEDESVRTAAQKALGMLGEPPSTL